MSGRKSWPLIEELYREEFSRFVRVARAITGERESAVDAVQEGFADALRRSSQWSGDGSLSAWVWTCVVNRARKARRQQTPTNSGGPLPVSSDADVDLRVRLAQLPERQRMVLFLRYFADLSYQEIATVIGVRVGTVSATLHAAHAALRPELREVTG
jgi:RNA polymerase sigma-70 factor, ECF subfamily